MNDEVPMLVLNLEAGDSETSALSAVLPLTHGRMQVVLACTASARQLAQGPNNHLAVCAPDPEPVWLYRGSSGARPAPRRRQVTLGQGVAPFVLSPSDTVPDLGERLSDVQTEAWIHAQASSLHWRLDCSGPIPKLVPGPSFGDVTFLAVYFRNLDGSRVREAFREAAHEDPQLAIEVIDPDLSPEELRRDPPVLTLLEPTDLTPLLESADQAVRERAMGVLARMREHR